MAAQAAHVAVVLAAGGSRRLGRPKQLLTREGETLVHRTVRIMGESSPQRLLVVVGAHRDEVAAALSGLACEAVFNPAWQHGLAGSLHAAAMALAGYGGAVLIAGCDQPALSQAHLRALLDGAATASSRCAATRYGDVRGIPVVVPGMLLSQVRTDDGDRGLGARLRVLPHATISMLDAPELGFDLDTGDDVRAAIARGWLDAAPSA